MDVARGLARILPVIAVAAALLLAPGPALADCQMAGPLDQAIAQAEVAFVGRVSEIDAGGRSAAVEVLEVWKGDVASRIVVDGGLDPANPAEDDRTFQLGVTYLFVPNVVEGHLVDGICTATAPWDEASMAGLRPAEPPARPSPAPAATGPLAELADLAGPLFLALIVGGAAFAVAIVVGRRRDT
ncbi:MAG: hypothetical protein EPO36_12010 [Chloroflexota bacterium]|nr:MAG: hypothetical protein EPO36_12010 [Chloroflexota bacterium]